MHSPFGAIAAICLITSTALCQIGLPPHNNTYNGYSRGFNFTANASMLIQDVELPLDAFQAGDEAAYLIRVNGAVALHSRGNVPTAANPGARISAGPLVIMPGDIVDVIGNWSPGTGAGNFTAHNSYGSGAPYATTIVGTAHTLNRVGWQWDIGDPAWVSTGATGNVLGVGSGSMGRVLVYATPPAGLFPSFNATPTTGPVNTPVQFTDTTFTSDPGGVLVWQWDLDGDGTTDSTVQNPLFTYTTEGIFDVTLTATDALHGTVAVTQTGYIEIDTVDASFATQFLPASTVIFTDTSTGSPTSWAWDVDGDNVTDYTTQNCAHVYPGPGAYNVTLTVTDAISTDTTTVNIGVDIIPMPPFTNTYSNANNVRGFWFQSPVKFSITSLQVPDETTFGTQNAAIYRGTTIAANGAPNGAQELEFISLLQPAANTIPCAVSFDVGDYVCVLGACGDAAIMHNSYGAGGPSSVLGQPITVARLYSQVNLNAPNPEAFTMIGSTVAAPSTIARVFCGVTSCSGVPYGTGSPSGNPGIDAPKMRCTDLPFLGTTATLSVEQGDAQVLGFMGTGLGRTSVPAPFGEILINNILGIEVMNGGTLVGPGTYTYSWNVPNNAGLIGVDVNHQYVQLDIPSNTIAMSNGVELQFAQ